MYPDHSRVVDVPRVMEVQLASRSALHPLCSSAQAKATSNGSNHATGDHILAYSHHCGFHSSTRQEKNVYPLSRRASLLCSSSPSPALARHLSHRSGAAVALDLREGGLESDLQSCSMKFSPAPVPQAFNSALSAFEVRAHLGHLAVCLLCCRGKKLS